MKKTFYTLKNKSGSEGTYLLNGEYKPLYPGEEITLDRPPVNKTANIVLTIYKKNVGSSEILRKKTVKQPEQESKKAQKESKPAPQQEVKPEIKQEQGASLL